ncbi:hypothetical protein [Ornithinibacillus bavariensis]|uniref:Uncharacterized protein n=1 Tax=Ornithinibacillus bavariensis TaxID=545502 RepID=A0A920C674_9BACI|nr:hypothetical protein [Ornithinibacillus bavariensis]GIO27490.1 hypothetical protein J43TS3_21010 [Ornithinibacillus bavariensis]HAM80242.1 hypothetical protein [Ornithinibacillus sp.]
MKDWWKRKREKARGRRKSVGDRYTIGEMIADILFWAPEIILLPFRLLFCGIRGLWRYIDIS